MRVLLVHNYYRARGGEDAVFEGDARFLRDAGVEVVTFARESREIEGYGLLRRALLPWRAIRGGEAVPALRAVIAKERPEVVHFHNTFPLLSPAALGACRDSGAAVVASLHNYRVACANALYYRQGRACEDCRGRTLPWPGVVHRCYHGSALQSAALGAMIAWHRARDTWKDAAHVFVAPSEWSRQRLAASGVSEAKLAVIPNAIADPGPPAPVPSAGPLLFVGRLVPEKGVDDLLRAAARLRAPRAVRIVGDGPERPALEELARLRVKATFTGALSAEGVRDEMGRAALLVAPSRCYETFGRVAAEAAAQGRPAVVPDTGALAEVVEPGRTGAHFRSGDVGSLTSVLDDLLSRPRDLQAMGVRSRELYESRYRVDVVRPRLLQIYRDAIARASS
jgi:glycosyltransferase involved in cell wall biosynthesis